MSLIPFPRTVRGLVYDAVIPRLTSKWYAEVLPRVCERATLLDVGIGTAGALLANADLAARRQLRVTGIDIDAAYIARARRRVQKTRLNGRVDLRVESFYDHLGGPYDAIYFSASFMVLPDPAEALRHCRELLGPGGRVFFTQTVHPRPSRWAQLVKPKLKWVTSIDFGRVTYEDELKGEIQAAGLALEEFSVLARHGDSRSCIAVARALPGSPPVAAAPAVARRRLDTTTAAARTT